MASRSFWIERLAGAETVEEFVDQNGEGCHCYSQPSVPVCGSRVLTTADAILHQLAEADRIEDAAATEAARLRASADAMAYDLVDRSGGQC